MPEAEACGKLPRACPPGHRRNALFEHPCSAATTAYLMPVILSLPPTRFPMSLSLYDVSVPAFLRGFANLTEILKKGEAFAVE
jgi:hypothetical protein